MNFLITVQVLFHPHQSGPLKKKNQAEDFWNIMKVKVSEKDSEEGGFEENTVKKVADKNINIQDFDKGEDRNVVENEDRENMKMVIKSEGFKVERGFEGMLEKEVENDRDGSEGKKSVGEEVVGFRVGGRQGVGAGRFFFFFLFLQIYPHRQVFGCCENISARTNSSA